jgi:hypothetical protein
LRSAEISPCSRCSSTIRPGQIRRNSSSLPTTSPGCLERRQQQVKGASAELYRAAFGEQLAAMRQDTEVPKFDDRPRIRQRL